MQVCTGDRDYAAEVHEHVQKVRVNLIVEQHDTSQEALISSRGEHRDRSATLDGSQGVSPGAEPIPPSDRRDVIALRTVTRGRS